MDTNTINAPTATKAPEFALETRSGKKVYVPAIRLIPKAEAIAAARSSTSVATRTQVFASAVAHTIRENPTALKSEPKANPENEAKRILTELETSLFGKDQPTDPIYKVVKSRYLGLHRLGKAVVVERNGELFAKPLRKVQAEMEAVKPPKQDDGSAFLKAVDRFTGGGLLQNSAPATREVCEKAMQSLGQFRETLLKVEQGIIPEGFGEGKAAEDHSDILPDE